jgi:hypothetical protein
VAGVAPVSEQQDLTDALAEHPCCFSREDAEKLVNAFAHELAEKIRQEGSDQWTRGNQDWDTHDAADLIDPEVP